MAQQKLSLIRPNTTLARCRAVTTSKSEFRTITMSDASHATRVPAPIAMPTSACHQPASHPTGGREGSTSQPAAAARPHPPPPVLAVCCCCRTCASAGESLMPSPTMATLWPWACSALTRLAFWPVAQPTNQPPHIRANSRQLDSHASMWEGDG